MKLLLKIVFIILLTPTLALAQVDRSVMPEAGPAPEIQIGKPATFTMKNGIKVFVVENNKLPRVAISMVLDRDPIQEGDKAGFVSAAGEMMKRGTKNKTKEQLDEAIDFLGANLSTSASSVFASSLSRNIDEIVALMAEVVLQPSFPEEELKKIKSQSKSGLAANRNSPEYISSVLTNNLIYGKNHPYAEAETEATIDNYTIEDIKNYYNTYWKPNIAYVAIVGDITVDQAKKLMEKNFGKWKKADVPKKEYDFPAKPENAFVGLYDRSESVQSNVTVAHVLDLPTGSDDVIAVRILNQILGGGGSGRLFLNLREDKGWTYGSYSTMSDSRIVGSFNASAQVRNEVTDSAVVEILKEMKRIQEEPVDEEELQLVKNSIFGSFARSMENPQTIASYAINTARYDLPEDYYNTYLQRVDDITREDIQAIAQKYLNPDQAVITVVGKGRDIAGPLSNVAPVRYFDIDGNEYEPEEGDDLGDITAEQVIENYLEALGGRDLIENLKSSKIKSSATIQGMPVEMIEWRMAPMNFKMELSVMGNVMNKQTFNGDRLVIEAQGQTIEGGEVEIAQAKGQAKLFPEVDYINNDDYQLKLVGTEGIKNKKAYEIEVTKGDESFSVYFDTTSGLKVRESRVMDTPQGKINLKVDFGKYEEVSGILVPHYKTLPLGTMDVDLNVEEVQINADFTEDTFQIK